MEKALNLSSALLHQIIELHSLEAWGKLRPNYISTEFAPVYRSIDRHYRQFLSLPTFDELKLGVRDGRTLEKVYAIECLEIDADPLTLLEYLKNEYTQGAVLESLEDYLDKSILIDNAEETLERLSDIVITVRDKIDIEDGQEPMQTIDPLYSQDEIAQRVSLGFNNHFDATTDFGRTDLIMIGGRRGHGKSITCANIVGNQFKDGHSAMYFTIEMQKKETFQRIIAATQEIAIKRLQTRTLTSQEWIQLAKFQAKRYVGGEAILQEYMQEPDYTNFHSKIVQQPLVKDQQLDIVYDPSLTTAKIRAEVERMKNLAGDNLAVVAVDYLNQIERRNAREGVYDWKEQVEVSKELKRIAQDYDVLMFVPYQIDSTGEARYAKGILDAADGAFVLNGWTKEDDCMTFTSSKMRNNNDEIEFTSEMDWDTLKIGPRPSLTPKEKEALTNDEDQEDAQELF